MSNLLCSRRRGLFLLPVLLPFGLPTNSHAASLETAPPDRIAEVLFHSADPAREESFPGRLEMRWGGRKLSRTIVRCMLALPPDLAEANDYGFYNLRLSGVVSLGELPVDRFDYRFDVPATEDGATELALVFDRDLRPGAYGLSLSVEDLAGGRRFAAQGGLDVPGDAPLPALVTASLAPAAPPPAAPLDPSVELVLPDSPILVGLNRVAARPRGPGIAGVRFRLDGAAVLARRRPPFSVELDFGREAAVRTLAVEAFGADGAVLAADERVINTGQERFAVDLVSPHAGERAGRGLTARAALAVPAGKRVSRLEFFVGDAAVAAFDRPPFDLAVPLPEIRGTAAVRAVARLSDGREASDTVLVNAPDVIDEVDVRLVELYAAVVDRKGRAVDGLRAAEFQVSEDGRPQRITRFERVANLPLHISLVLDTSGSMAEEIDEVGRAAIGFLRAALTPADEATIVTFDDTPHLVVESAGDFARLANALTGLRATGDTALHDGLLFALRQAEGVGGQRVALLFSDGQEGRPRDPTALLEFARRAGVTVYSIGFRIPEEDLAARELLEKLAADTGGRSFFLAAPGDLAATYAEIQQDMRSRYLLAYQSSEPAPGPAFRVVDVGLARSGVEVRTMRGYYP